MKQTIFLISLLFFCIACQKEELPESGEETVPKAKTLCEKYVSHIQSPFSKSFHTKAICMDSVHLILFRNPKWDTLSTFYDPWIASPKLNLVEFATVTGPRKRTTDSLFALTLEKTPFDFSTLSMSKSGDSSENIDIPFHHIPYSYYRYARNDQFDIFKKNEKEIYIWHDFELDIYSTETGKIRPKINAYKREFFDCMKPTPAFKPRAYLSDSSILIKANAKMHSNTLEYFFKGDSLRMNLLPDYCLVMAFYRDNGERKIYKNANCTQEMLDDPRGAIWNPNRKNCIGNPFPSCFRALPGR